MDIRQAVEQVAEHFKPSIREGWTRTCLAWVERYKAARAERLANPKPGDERNKPGVWQFIMGEDSFRRSGAEYRYRRMIHDWLIYNAEHTVPDGKFSTRRELKPDAELEQVIAAQAAKRADEIVASFVQKISAKLAGILESHEQTPKIDTTGHLSHNLIKIEFPDGAGFQVQSQIVNVWPTRAIPHSKYPTTFHDARGPGGVAIKTPSEAKVKAAFKGVANA
jgi:hypothetical protein